MPETIDIEVIKGRTWERSVYFLDLNLTGCIAKMTIAETPGGTPVLSLTSTPAAGITLAQVASAFAVRVNNPDQTPAGTSQVTTSSWVAARTITPTQTEALSAGRYFYDFVLIWPSVGGAAPVQDEIHRGTVTVLGRATSP